MLFPFDNSYARLQDAFSTPIEPTPVSAPVMIQLNHDLATELGSARSSAKTASATTSN